MNDRRTPLGQQEPGLTVIGVCGLMGVSWWPGDGCLVKAPMGHRAHVNAHKEMPRLSFALWAPRLGWRRAAVFKALPSARLSCIDERSPMTEGKVGGSWVEPRR